MREPVLQALLARVVWENRAMHTAQAGLKRPPVLRQPKDAPRVRARRCP